MINVSVIVPIYNGEKYIKKCIDSIVNQKLKNIEIIVVDDGSTDETSKIIKQLQKKYSNLIYIYQDNARQGKARNTGLKIAKGKYISFIDGDDYINSNMYYDMFNYGEKNNYDIVFCDFETVSEKTQEYTYCHKGIKSKDRVTAQEFALTTPAPWNKLFKREFLQKNKFKFLEYKFYEDFASTPQLAKYQAKIGYIPKAYYKYYQSDNSTTRSDNYQSKREDIHESAKHLYDNINNIDSLKEEYEYLFIYHYLYLSSLYFYKYKKFKNIEKISLFMKEKYPKWQNNKYLKKETKKFRILCFLFYHKKYNIIKTIQNIKSGVKYERKNI